MLSPRCLFGLAWALVCLTACAPVPAHRSTVTPADADGDGGSGGSGGEAGSGGTGGGTGGSADGPSTDGAGGETTPDASPDRPPPVDVTPTAPPAAPTVMVTAGDAQVMLSWAAVPGATGYTVKRSDTALGSFAPLVPKIPATSYVDTTAMNGTAYFYKVSASNAAGDGPDSATQTATPVAGWSSEDVGGSTPPGTTMQNGAAFTLTGGPGDIYNNADVLRFAFQNVSGDATITARVASLQNVDAYSKAGVMMRAGVDPGAINVAAVTTPTAANGHRLQSRTTAAGTTAQDKSNSGNAPIWLRLVRRGNVFTASTSANGTTWATLGTAKTITMPAMINVGLALSSHVVTTAGSAMFDNVSITRP
jgi:regulation of enolase protein 1 (concanavalin A-like superfamily)